MKSTLTPQNSVIHTMPASRLPRLLADYPENELSPYSSAVETDIRAPGDTRGSIARRRHQAHRTESVPAVPNPAAPNFENIEKHVPDEPRLNLDEAWEANTLAILEGLAHALGTSNAEPGWTVGHGDSSELLSYINQYPDVHTTQEEDYTNNIPLITLNAPNSRKIQLTVDTDLGPDAATLESGFYRPPVTPKTPGSPYKLSGMLSRISDRIAGSNTPLLDSSPHGKLPIDYASKRSSVILADTFANVHGLGLSRLDSEVENPDSDRSYLGTAASRAEYSPNSQTSRPHSYFASTDSLGPTLEPNTASVSTLPINVSTGLPPLSAFVLSSKRPSPFDQLYLYGHLLRTFGPENKFRIWCHRFLAHPRTSSFILALIMLQTALLSYRQWNPQANKGYYYNGYNWADYILIFINILYTGEVVAKIVAYGLLDDSVMFEELGLDRPHSDFLHTLQRVGKLTRENFFSWVPEREFWKKRASSSSGSESIQAKYDPFMSPAESVLQTSREHIPKLRNTNTFLRTSKKKVADMNLQRAYLRNSWQRLDFMSLVAFWISLPLSYNHYDARHHLMLFRALSCFRILRLCNLTTGTNIILRACQSAIPQLIDVSIFIVCFWFIFAIIGVQSFKSSLTRHCVWTNPDDATDTYVYSDLYCGSQFGPDGNPQPFYHRDGELSDYVKGYRCPVNSRCVSGENPYNGTISFDNVLQSLELVFVTMSANTFTDIMYYTMDTDNLGSSIFFMFAIFILTVWLMNVFIAVIVASFNIAQMEEAEDKKRKIEGRPSRKYFGILVFNDDLHHERVTVLVHKKPLLKLYYRCEFLFVLIIGAAMVIQALRNDKMTDDTRHSLYRCEVAVTAVLIFEIITRFVLYLPEWRTFFLSRRNSFDMVLAIITGIIIIGPVKAKLGHAYYWLTVFQLARFYRVVLSFSVTRDLWAKITHNIKAIYDLTLFYFILTGLTSIILARFFEGAVPKDELSSIDFPMHTLPNAFVALYIITSTENWTNIMYGLQEYAVTTSQRSFGSMFLIGWFIVSNSVLLNIFIAVIARTLEVSEQGKRRQQLRQFIDDMTERLQTVNSDSSLLSKFKQKVFKRKDDQSIERAVTNLLLSGTAVNDFLEEDVDDLSYTEDVKDLPKNSIHRWLRVNFARAVNILKNPFFSTQRKGETIRSFDPALFAKNVIADRNKLIIRQDEYLKQNPLYNTVFYMMGPRHRLRRLCQRVVRSSHGERIDGVEPNEKVGGFVLVFMFIATIGIVVTASYLTPLYRREVIHEYGQWNWTFYIDVTFIAIFTFEFLIKIIADGLLLTPNAYMRSSWNWLDFTALLSLWIEFIAFLKNDGNLSRIVRGIKALRALRILTISETAKNNFHYTMISGFGKIMSAALISVTLIFPFSIWGLNIFNGRLGSCIDGVSTMEKCFNEYENEILNWTITSPNVYTQPLLEMNRFSSSFSSLYEIVSLEGWVDLLMTVMLSTGTGTVQAPFASPFNGVFVVIFNFIGIVFILTLFVSVIIDNYSRVTGGAYLTKAQIQWYQVKKFLTQVKPSKRTDRSSLKGFRRFCYKMTIEKYKPWSIALNFMLLIHVVSLLTETFPEQTPITLLRYCCFMFSSTCFLLNCIMLSTAQGHRAYILNKWNVFQFLVSFGAWITTILSFPINSASVFNNFNKLFLTAMLIFIFPRSNRLSQLLKFASASFPSLLSLMFTWFVVFMVYAIAMNQVFGMTKIGANTTDNINVRSVPKALILLFRCSFGEGWNYIMDDFALESPRCTSDVSIDESDCGNKQYAYILFMSWNVISMYIFLNLFVSLILDSFSYINSGSDYAHLISREEIRKFKKTWETFDPAGTGFIKPFDLPKLLHSLEGSLSFHFYSGSMSIPELSSRWITRNNPHDPYDITVNHEAMNEIMNEMDIPKIQERRRSYERFLEEAIMNMEMYDEPGISFNRVLLQIPLYNSFDAGQCLVLLDFLDRRIFCQKLEKRLKMKRCYETILAYACRWKYVENQRHGIRDANITFDGELKRRSYFSNQEYAGKEPTSETLEMEVSSSESDPFNDEDESAPFTKSKKLRKTSDYVPASHIQLYRTGPDSAQLGEDQRHSQNFTDRYRYSSSLDDRLGNPGLSPFADPLSIAEQRTAMTIVDLPVIGGTLENSSWGPALRGMAGRKSPNLHSDSE